MSELDAVKINVMTGERESSPTAAPLPTNEAVQQQQQKEAQVIEMQNILRFRIAALKSAAGSSPSKEVLDQIDNMEAAMVSGNLQVLSLAFVASSDIKAAINKEQAEEALYNNATADLEEMYPSYGSYSRESQRYIAAQLQESLKNSGTLQALNAEYMGLPQPDMDTAKQRIKENWQEYKSIAADAAIADKYKGQLEAMKAHNLVGMPQAAEAFRLMREGRDPAEIAAIIEAPLKAQVAVARGVIAEVYPQLSDASKEHLAARYGNPPDADKVVKDWAKISHNDRNEAFQAYERSGRDISKLPPEQQHIIHLSKVTVAVDAAQTLNAGIAMAKNEGLMRQITDKSISVEERGEIFERAMAQQGISISDSATRDRLAQEYIRMIDEKPGAIELARAGKIRELGAAYQRELTDVDGLAGQTTVASNAPFNYDNAAMSFQVAAFAVAAQEIPDYIKRDPVKLAAYQQEAKEWAEITAQANYAQKMVEANTNLAGSEHPMTPEQTAAFLADYNQKVATTATQTAEPMAAATAAPEAAPVQAATAQAQPSAPSQFVGIAGIPSLAALGVSGGATYTVGEPQSAVVATVLQPSAAQGAAY